MENFGKFMTVILALIISPIINGFVFMKLWTWFIVSTFHAQPVRIVEAIGIIFLINFVFAKRDKTANTEKFWENITADMGFLIAYAGVALLFGWIVTLFL